MESIYQQPQQNRRKVIRPTSSLKSLNLGNRSKVLKLNSFQLGSKLENVSKLNGYQRGSRLQNMSKLNGYQRGSKLENKLIKPQITFEQEEITQQLQTQIVAIEQCLYNYRPFLKQIKQKSKRKTSKDKLFYIEDLISNKDSEIKIVSEQIKQLRSVNGPAAKNSIKNAFRQQDNTASSEQNQKNGQNNIFKLAQQLKVQRQLLQKLQTQHRSKQQKHSQIKEMVDDIQQKFIQRCHETRQRPLRYQQFKQLNQEKKRQIQIKANKRLQQMSSRQRQSSIRQSHQFTSFHVEHPPRNVRESVIPVPKANPKSLKQLQNRKTISKQALKNASKKHNNSIRQLMAKIQFLRDEDSLLLQKINQKQQQRILLESKFNEQRGAGSFHSRTHHGLWSPANRPVRDNKFRVEGMGLSDRINNYLSSPSPMSNSSGQPQQHHFSPHRKLVSARKNIQQIQLDPKGNQVHFYGRQTHPTVNSITQSQDKIAIQNHHKIYNDYEQQNQTNNF